MNSGCLGRLRTTLSSAFDRAINEGQNDCGLSLPKYSIRSSSTCCNCYYSFWNSRQSSVKIFPYNVHILCSKCPPPAEAHAFRRLRKSLIALLIVVCGKSSQICCDALFSSGMGLGLWVKFVKCLKHCTQWMNESINQFLYWMIIKWVEVWSSFTIHPLRWSRHSWPSASPASDGPCELERRLAGIWIQMEAVTFGRLAVIDFRLLACARLCRLTLLIYCGCYI